MHTNYAGNAEWKIDYVQVKGDGQNVKFRCKEWLQKTDCDNRLQLDIYAPKPSKIGAYTRFLFKRNKQCFTIIERNIISSIISVYSIPNLKPFLICLRFVHPMSYKVVLGKQKHGILLFPS